ncbi:DUF3618 domain-containing protein [Defluviimonas sp. WL0024]|uniref:DUF3618 domain-containing protein n=1 Tax=Albidovulum salinarum TaxID=2984153 RepID=A0ABT2X9D2_9RHOB|nr:DUF3618 domain-containing protein [Defluviimonas sp. WL0024]MCU9850235.1 DUF3618 domain-containing protein [Defluviimonas sp. WL0024]
MAHQTDARTIEAELERDRASLSSTLDELQERISVDHLAKEALGMLRTNAGVYSRSIDSAIRANPMALALTGVGLAWLIFGGKKAVETPIESAVSRWESEGGAAYPGAGITPGTYKRTDANQWSSRIDELRDRASALLRGMERDARDYAGNLRDYAAERSKVLAGFTEDMRASFRDGLDDLSEAARYRIVRAREQAYAARLRAERTARGGGREMGQLIEEHPMVAGVVAMALGAAFAAALPRTRTEDRAFGADSDRLMDAAAELLRDERARLSRVADDIAEEVKVSAKDAASAIAAKTKEIGENVMDRAEEEVRQAAAKQETAAT